MFEFGSDWSLPRKEQAFRFEVSVYLWLHRQGYSDLALCCFQGPASGPWNEILPMASASANETSTLWRSALGFGWFLAFIEYCLSMCATGYNLRADWVTSSCEHTELLRWGQCGLSDLVRIMLGIILLQLYAYGMLWSEGCEAWRVGTSILRLMRAWGGVESRLDQNISWVIVEIPPEKILLEQIF